MRKTVNYLGLPSMLLLMIAAVLTYLAPHLGWRAPDLGYVSLFLLTPFGFVLCLVVPTLVFSTVYVRIIRQYLARDKMQNSSEIASR